MLRAFHLVPAGKQKEKKKVKRDSDTHIGKTAGLRKGAI